MDTHEQVLKVAVDLMDDDGNTLRVFAYGRTVDEAVASAEQDAGGSYVMNDWHAA